MAERTIGIVANTSKPEACAFARTFREALHERGLATLIEEATSAVLGEQGGVPLGRLEEKVELLVVLGGDGSILRVVRELPRCRVPILGINLGKLGFLTCVTSDEAESAVEAIVSGTLSYIHRTLLRVSVLREDGNELTSHGLNDAVLGRNDLSRLWQFSTFIDGERMADYNADGLIVSTSTGSTAYSLSAGGPIVMPGSGVFVITPICPHVLANRPVVVPDSATLEVVATGNERQAGLTIDGAFFSRIEAGDRVRISKSPHKIAIAALPKTTFFRILERKLKWSGSAIGGSGDLHP